MRKPSEFQGSAKSSAQGAPAKQKRPYRAPRLTDYGNLRELALAKGGVKGDGGGKPASKV